MNWVAHLTGNLTISSATREHRRLNYAPRQDLANVLNVAADDVRDLPSLAWIERDMRIGDMSRGKVKFG